MVGFVDEPGGVEGVARPLAAHQGVGEGAELFVVAGDEFRRRDGIGMAHGMLPRVS
jgi:hypothetical protein